VNSNVESRLAALEAVRDEQRARIDLFYNKDWSRLTGELHLMQAQLREMSTSIATLSATVAATIAQQAHDLRQMETTVESLPARALTAGGILIGILIGLAQLTGHLKI